MTKLTRFNIVKILQNEGYDVEERTIRYWEQSKRIPKAVRDGKYTYHNLNILPSIRLLCATRPKNIQIIRQNIGTITEIFNNGDLLTIVVKKGKHV